MTELEIIHEQLDKACCPEDVFGTIPAMIPHLFKDLAKAVHPDRNHAEAALADKAFQALIDLKNSADKRVKEGTFGQRLPLPKCQPIEIGNFHVDPKPIVGDIADLYRTQGNVHYVKVARHHDDNDLMRAEAAALTALAPKIPAPVNDGIPKLRDSFTLDGTWKRQVNVVTAMSGFVTLQHVHSKIPVLPAQAVWIFKRLLVLIEYVHHAGFVHGAILPPHVMVYPDNDGRSERDPRKHSIRLIDWCYSVPYQTRTRLSAWLPAWKGHYAPELVAKKGLSPASDIYMAAKLICYVTDQLPAALEVILLRCMENDPKKRYQDAGKVFDDWRKAAIEVYGSPKWIDFNLPK